MPTRLHHQPFPSLPDYRQLRIIGQANLVCTTWYLSCYNHFTHGTSEDF